MGSSWGGPKSQACKWRHWMRGRSERDGVVGSRMIASPCGLDVSRWIRGGRAGVYCGVGTKSRYLEWSGSDREDGEDARAETAEFISKHETHQGESRETYRRQSGLFKIRVRIMTLQRFPFGHHNRDCSLLRRQRHVLLCVRRSLLLEQLDWIRL